MTEPFNLHQRKNGTAVRERRQSATASPTETVPRRRPTVTAVIPTLNEADNIKWVLMRLPQEVDEIIVVDGASTDDTVLVAKTARPDVRVVHQDGKGKGNALACGFREATSDLIVMLDADGSTDPVEIPRFVAALETGAQFAKGTRFVTGGGSADITILRKWGNKVLTALVNSVWRTQYSDLCYGYNAFWRSALAFMNPDSPGFEIETLLAIRVAASGLPVVEVPSFEGVRLHGVSNLNARRDGIRVLRTILAEWLRPGEPTVGVLDRSVAVNSSQSTDLAASA